MTSIEQMMNEDMLGNDMPKILAIDDQIDNLITIKAVIKAYLPEYHVLVAQNGPDGIDLAREEQPEVILLDIIMPGMDGYQVCQKLKFDPETDHIPVVMVTAIKTDSASRIKGLDIGADAFISKPIDAPELVAQLKVMIRIRQTEEKLIQEKARVEQLVVARTMELSAANEALIESERRLMFHIENSPLAAIEWDSNFAVTRWAGEAEKIFGWSASETVGIPFNELNIVYEDDLSIAAKTMGQLTNSDSNYVIAACRNYTKSGKLIDCQWYNSVLHDETGKMVSVMSQVLDVTDRKNAEKELMASELKYRSLIENSSDAIFCVDEKGQYQFTNHLFASTFGKTPEELIGKTFWDLYSKELADMRFAATKRLFETGESESLEVEVPLPSGTQYFWATTNPIKDDSGKVILNLTHATNITSLKQTEEALKNTVTRNDALLRAIPDMMFLFDTDCRIIDYHSNRTEDLYVPPEVFLGKNVEEILPPELVEATREKVGLLMKGQSCDNLVYQLEVNGELRHFESRYVLCGENQVLSIVRDITESKNAQDQIQAGEQKFRDIFNHSADAAFIFDVRGKLLEVNRVAMEQYGYSYSEFLTLTMQDLIVPEAGKNVPEPGNFEDQVRVFEETHRRHDDSSFPVEVHASKIDFDGQPCILAHAHDITSRKKTEAELRESSQKIEAIITASPDGIGVASLEGKMQVVSDRLATMYGYAVDEIPELLGRSFFDFIDSTNHKMLRINIAKLVSGEGAGRVVEYLARKKDDSRFYVEINSTLLLDSKGNPECVLFVERDITTRRQAEIELRNSEEKFKAMFDEAPVGIALVDTQSGQFYSVNAAYAKISGRTVEQLIAMDWMCTTHPDDIKTQQEKMTLMRDGKITEFQMEKRYILPNGSTTWVQLKVLPITRFSTGRPLHYAMVEDITDRKQAIVERTKLQDQLRQAQKMEAVGRLAGGVAHDYNNMLSVIIGHAELALERLDQKAALQADLEGILKASHRSAEITRQLLAFARKQTIRPKILDLNETVGSMLKMIQRLLGEDIELVWVPGKQLWPVKMDPSQVDQVLANLCVNARDAITGVGKIIIGTDKISVDDYFATNHPGAHPGDYLILTVSDNGIGMDSATVEQIFEPFFTTKPTGKGTGLGLATVYGIVKQNEGFIDVYSEPGEGATFKIYLPRQAGDVFSHTHSPGKSEIPRGNGESILLVEDEPAVREMGHHMLTSLGYEVKSVLNPLEALKVAKAAKSKFSLLITDVVMPEMNGRELASQCRQNYPEVKVLFMSGYTADVIAHRGVLDDDVNFIQKPFTIRDLAIKVRKVLDSK